MVYVWLPTAKVVRLPKLLAMAGILPGARRGYFARYERRSNRGGSSAGRRGRVFASNDGRKSEGATLSSRCRRFTFGAPRGFAVDPERSDLAPGHEHHVPRLHLELVGADELGGGVDRGGLEDDVLGTDVERGIG